MFIEEDFLLKNETAKHLYHTYAENQPIIDYHCHIQPREIYENRKFESITQVWLGGDHYKWRLMRSDGISEDEITGSADDKTKFLNFARVLPKAMGNPMYHWCHLELKRYFGYEGILNEDSAEEVYNLCNQRLQQDDMRVRSIIEKSNVKIIGTTDDPVDSLEWHEKLRNDKSFSVKVVPSFRPDKAINISKEGFREYIKKLSSVSGIEIKGVKDVEKALAKRLDFFCKFGCKASDHGLDEIPFETAEEKTVDRIFKKAMAGRKLTISETRKYQTALLIFLGQEYYKRGIVMQLHYGAQRNTNTKMFKRLGADTGFDCIGPQNGGYGVTGLLDALEQKGCLPKTVLYSLSPQDNELIDSILGCFQGTETNGKIQHGSAWWFNDTKSGMEAHLYSLANLSLLGNYIGMLTDSRSFLSYTRHEYFRRILCNILGQWVESGEYPNDEKSLGKTVQDICYGNAERYFGWGKEE